MLRTSRRLGLRVLASSKASTLIERADLQQKLLSTAILQAGQSSRSYWRREEGPESTWSSWDIKICRGFCNSRTATAEISREVQSGDHEEVQAPDSPTSNTGLDEAAEDTAGSLLSADAITYAVSSAEDLSLAAAWDNAWWINKGFQYAIQGIHSYTGLAWWQSIALSTVAARTLTFPLTLKQIRNTHNMTKARPELQRLADWFSEQQAAGRGQEAQQEYMRRMTDVWAKYDCNPFKSMLPLLAQAPIFIGFFQALNSMSAAKVPSLTVGGPAVAWYADLTAVDPYYTLPIASSLALLVTVELNAADGLQGQDPTIVRRTKNFMRVLSGVMLFATSGMPQGVFYYWITSSLLALAQSIVLKVGSIRKTLKLPPLEVAQAGGKPEVAAMAATAAGKPVKTFSSPPKKQKEHRQSRPR